MPSSFKYRGYPRRSKNYYASKIQAAARRRAAARRAKSMPTRSLTRMIKNVSLKNSETKRSSDYQQGLVLNHNTTRYYGGLLDVRHGIGNPDGGNTRDNLSIPGTRVGAEIFAKGLSFKFQLERDTSHPDTFHRIVVFKYKQGQTLDDGLFWQGANGNGVNNILRTLDTIETSEVKVLKHLLVRPTTNLGLYTDHREFYVNLKNTRVKYSSGLNELETPEHWNIGFAVVAVSKHNVPITAAVATLNYSWKLFFKDP